MNKDWETIISVGAEGGSIRLLGKEQHGKWLFQKSVNEITFDEPKDECIPPTREIRKLKYPNLSNEADSWKEALEQLDQYPWPMLHPLEVHPAFRKHVWTALKERFNQMYRNRKESFQLSHWAAVCFPGYSMQVITLAEWLQKSSNTTLLTGAGMSTESNIPDFRSKDGWWKNIDPRTVATMHALRNHYDLFHEFYCMRINGLKNYVPHKGYEILAEWEEKGIIQTICTQNVDNFHKESGNQNVYELHGSIHKIRCVSCLMSASMEKFLNKDICNHCGSKLRPGIVLFGEMLPEDVWVASLSKIRQSNLVIVIGTSLEVYPASKLPQMTNGKTVYINAEIEGNHNFDLIIKGKAVEVLKQVNELITQYH